MRRTTGFIHSRDFVVYGPMMHFRFHLVLLAALAIVVGFGSSRLEAQPGRRSSRNRNNSFDAKAFLQRLDLNRNKYLDPTESRGQTQQLLQKFGLDPNRSHKIDTIVDLINNKGKNSDQADSKDANRKVPGFGVDSELVGIPDFSPTGEERMSLAAMRTRFGDNVMAQVDRTMRRYDADKSGILEPAEVQRARWRNPSAAESDTNQDGNLSRLELCYRYYEREQAAINRKSSPGARSTNNSRGSTVARNRSSTSAGRGGQSTANRRSGSYSRRANSSAANSKRKAFNSGNDAYDRYAEGLLKNYDKDKDRKLSKAELKEMRRPPENADRNRDGFVDKDELVASIMRKSGVSPDQTASSSGARSPGKSGSRADRLRRPANASYNQADSIFGGKDLNNDRQLQMAEFTDDWDEEAVSEFEEKDANDDGVITEKEWQGGS